MSDIAQRGNRLTKRKYEPIQNKALVRDVYEHVAHKHSLGQKKKPHSSKEGVTASAGRALRDVGKIFGSERVGKFGGGRTNLLEELGRVEAEPSNRNRRAEISRVHGELNRGYAKGGRAGFKHGKQAELPKDKQTQPSGRRRVIPSGKMQDKKTPLHTPRIPQAKGGRIGLKKGDRAGFAHGTSALKKAIGRITHEVPTGPHTDVRRRNLNPSFVDKSIESGRTKERKRKQKIMGMGWKNVAKRMVGQKEGGRIGLKKGGSDKKWIQKAVNPKHKGYCTPMTKKTCTPARKALARTFKKKAKTGW